MATWLQWPHGSHHRQGFPAPRRHATPRPDPRRRAPRADGRRRLRSHRDDPPYGDPLPSRHGDGAPATSQDLEGPARRTGHPRNAERGARVLATSRISPTSPRTCSRTAGAARTRWPARPRSAAASPMRSSAWTKPGIDGAARCALARWRAGEPGAHRAPDRGAAQEHARRRARDRPPAAVARPRRVDARRSGGVRDGARAPGALAVADRDAAPVEAARARRDRQRARVLPLHVPRRGAAAVRGARGRRARHVRDARRLGAAALPAPRVVDRRRSRRQPVRDRRHAATTRSVRSRRVAFDALPRARCTRSAPSCRCRRASCIPTASSWRSRPRRTTSIRIAATSRTGGADRHLRASRRDGAALSGYGPPAPAAWRRSRRMPPRRSSPPISA